jgi:hypothetical protein
VARATVLIPATDKADGTSPAKTRGFAWIKLSGDWTGGEAGDRGCSDDGGKANQSNKECLKLGHFCESSVGFVNLSGFIVESSAYLVLF